MKRYLLLFMSSMLLATNLSAQIWDGIPFDSVTIRFSDSTLTNIYPDTASTPLWQIGKTFKSGFTTDTNGLTAIMTDTVNFYPIASDNWFAIKLFPMTYGYTIINIWHRYETDSSLDGGIVEFSSDNGITWQNIMGDCHPDVGGWYVEGILTENFYSKTDTLITGMPAFSGKKNTTRLSRFQFSGGYLSSPPPLCSIWPSIFMDTISVRFRFMSDSVADTFAGWIIDSIKIERDRYILSVDNINFKTFTPPTPNPSHTGTFTFPPLKNEQQHSIEVYNPLGQKVVQTPYNQSLNLGHLPKGLYLYKVTDGTMYYSGRLLYE